MTRPLYDNRAADTSDLCEEHMHNGGKWAMVGEIVIGVSILGSLFFLRPVVAVLLRVSGGGQ